MESYNLKKLLKKSESYIKMDKKFIKFDVTEIKEYEFHQHENSISLNDIDIMK